jgi:predicted RecB family endonuclease
LSVSRGFWTEQLALFVLESEGFEVLGRREKIVKGSSEIAEVDLVARKQGELYAVEVKSGKVSVTDVRQAYTNARLLGAKPLILARGFSDDSARALAEELGVQVILLPEYMHFVSPEELAELVEKALVSVLDRLLPAEPPELSEEEARVLEALARGGTFPEAARLAGMREDELGRALERLREKGLFMLGRSPSELRLQAKVLLLLRSLLRSRPAT